MNDTEKIYYYLDDNKQTQGPVCKQELRQLLALGKISDSTFVIRKGESQWSRLSNLFPDLQKPEVKTDPAPSPKSDKRPKSPDVAPVKKYHALAKGEVYKQFFPILNDTYVIALKNFISVFLACILWLLTIWIPYLNMGTTIAITNLPVDLARGKVISPTCIFAARYRQFYGEYNILIVLMFFCILVGLAMFIIPGIVLSYSWMFAPMLLIDKGVNATEALTLSNKYTYGNKFACFVVALVSSVTFFIICGILYYISDVLCILVSILLGPVMGICLLASLYKRIVLMKSQKA